MNRTAAYHGGVRHLASRDAGKPRRGRRARAKWKIENESFSVLKNNGFHLEHNFGHGKQNLAMLFAAMNLLAFAMHTVYDLIEGLWIKAREAKRAHKRFFDHMRTITAYLIFPDRKTLMLTLITSKPRASAQHRRAKRRRRPGDRPQQRGLSTKIHATVDAPGNPTGIHLTPGQTHDLVGAKVLLPGLRADTLLADKAYDADELANIWTSFWSICWLYLQQFSPIQLVLRWRCAVVDKG